MFHSDSLGPIVTSARRDNALSQRQLALLASAPVSVIIDLELGKLDHLTANQLLLVLHQVGLDMKIVPIPGPRPTYDDLVRSDFEKQRAELFKSWLNC